MGDGFVIITKGLEPGELVAAQGNFQIDSALQIQAKPSMMNQDGGTVGTGAGSEHAGHTMAAGTSREGYYVPPMPTVSLTEGLGHLINQYQAAKTAAWGDDLHAARRAMRDLRRAFTRLPSASDATAEESALTKQWRTLRPGIETGLQEAMAADNLATLRSAFETLRMHLDPLAADVSESRPEFQPELEPAHGDDHAGH